MEKTMRKIYFECENVDSFIKFYKKYFYQYFAKNSSVTDVRYLIKENFIIFIQHNIASELHDELKKHGLLEWSTRINNLGRINGFAELNTFESAFKILSGCLPIKGAYYFNHWYKDWAWIQSENQNKSIFTAIHEELNDDCIREITRYLDYQNLIHFSRFNGRFKDLASERFSRCHINLSAFGSIDVMNFRYFLEIFGSSITQLSLSLSAFPSTFGHYFDDKKINIIQTFFCCSNQLKLKKIYLYEFHLSKTQKERFEYFVTKFSQQGTELIEMD